MGGGAVSDATSTWGERGERSTDEERGVLRRGTTLGRYVLIDLLGRGGMGAVYAAYDTQLERRVALKLLHRGPADQVAERVFAEARALAQLRHRNVVAIHDAAELDAFVFLAMDLAEGRTLRDYADAEDKPEQATIVALLVQCARGLAAVHRAGLVHRDFKPNNVVVDTSEESPRAIVVDFGLAVPDADLTDTPAPDGTPEAPALPWAGTPAYMAPECFEDGGGPSSDQWSFAMTCAELLGGRRPTRAEIADGKLPIPAGALRDVIARGLHADPSRRWETLDAMADAMEAALRPRRTGLWVMGALVVAIGASGLTWALGGDGCDKRAREAADAIWNDARAELIAARMEHVDPSVSKRFVSDLEAWSEQWRSTYVDVCGGQKLESSAGWCLEDRARTVGLVVELVAEGSGLDAELHRISGVLPRLPDPDGCNDPDLERRPQPTAGERAASASRREQLDRAGVLELLGQFDEAAELVEAAWDDDASVGLRANIAQRQASIAWRRGELDDALAHAKEAMRLAAEAKDDWLVATVALDLADIMVERGDVDALTQHLEYAEVAVKRAPPSPRFDARLHFVKGRYYEVALDLEAALREHEKGLAIRQESLPGSLYVADSEANVGLMLGKLGRLDESLATLDAALTHYRELLGDVHPDIAHLCVIRGLNLQRMGRNDEAMTALEGCIEMLETTVGEDHPKLAFASMVLGMGRAQVGDYEGAAKLMRRAVEIREVALGPDHPETGIAHTNLGNILAALQDPAAREHLERARAITVATYGEDSSRLSSIHSGLGQLAANDGDWKTAHEHFERGLEIETAAAGEDNPSLLVGLLNLAQTRAELGDARTEETWTRAEAIMAKAGIESHPLRPIIDVGMAKVAMEAGERDVAVRRLDAALAAMEETEPSPGLRDEARRLRERWVQ